MYISIIWFIDIKDSNPWYQQFEFLSINRVELLIWISKSIINNSSLFIDINDWMIDINNSNYWYQHFEILVFNYGIFVEK